MASEGEIILSYFDTCLRKSDVDLLLGNKWINDNIIAFWFEYLENDLYSSNREEIILFSPQVTQFIKSASLKQNHSDVSSMLSSMNLKEKSLIIIPVNDCDINSETIGGTHWSLLVYISNKQTFEHYDSHTGSINRYHAENIVSVLTPVLLPGHESDLELDFAEMECTQQENSYDCGIHLICNTEAICRKYFREDNRHISDISSPKAIARARRDLLKLIYSLKRKLSGDETDK